MGVTHPENYCLVEDDSESYIDADVGSIGESFFHARYLKLKVIFIFILLFT